MSLVQPGPTSWQLRRILRVKMPRPGTTESISRKIQFVFLQQNMYFLQCVSDSEHTIDPYYLQGTTTTRNPGTSQQRIQHRQDPIQRKCVWRNIRGKRVQQFAKSTSFRMGFSIVDVVPYPRGVFKSYLEALGSNHRKTAINPPLCAV